jgi:site-specific DNA recombinase
MRIALYARVSTVRQAENDLSIPDQLRQLRAWCEANGHSVSGEYVEPGASATDDKRPVFQQMIADAMLKPAAFDVILIHSLSRFFRDMVEFGVYENRLRKNGVKVISITQPTGDDAAGEMARRMFTLFDEYQSKEISKHVTRAMRENARQGYFNGCKAPFGYERVATDTMASRGRKKKRLGILEAEASIVRLIYTLYLHGLEGKRVGCKEIAKHLVERGLLMRGKPWSMKKVHRVLSDTVYMGEYYYGVNDSKTGQKRPPEEWVKSTAPAIVDAALFQQVRAKRESSSPDKVPASLLTSPTLLTGILKCGCCGAGMTLSTGKGGRYRYYKCTSRRNYGNYTCKSVSLPMDKTDRLVLEQLADKVFTAERLRVIIDELRTRFSAQKDGKQQEIAMLLSQLKQLEERESRIYEAIEEGGLRMNETLKDRLDRLQLSRDAIQVDLVKLRQQRVVPLEQVKPAQIDAFGKVLRDKLLAPDSALAKGYVRLLVDNITVREREATMTGSYAAIAHAMEGMGKNRLETVPTDIPVWRARRESNPRPSA